MNQPDRYSRFVLPSGVDQAVEYKSDTKMRAAGQFNIWLEDHTVGNLVRHQLLTNPEVRWYGVWWWGSSSVCFTIVSSALCGICSCRVTSSVQAMLVQSTSWGVKGVATPRHTVKWHIAARTRLHAVPGSHSLATPILTPQL